MASANPVLAAMQRGYRYLIYGGDALQSPLLLVVRLYWGWQFYETGKGKLMNFAGTADYFASLGIPAPMFNAYFVGGVECFGGLLLLVGLFSRPIALVLAGNMTVAYLTAHLDQVKSIWSDSDQFVSAAPFLFLLASLIVLCFGPGAFSADRFLTGFFRKSA